MGNFSRDTFDKLRHYVGVRLQQGVPIVDADWNELEDIRRYELQAFLRWFVDNGVPRGNDGFHILPVETNNDFAIKGGDGTTDGAGRCLVEGWDVINESTLNYTAQPLFNNPSLATTWGVAPLLPLTTPTTARTDTVYLDVWEREVDAKEDTNIVNPAIGIETCVRRKREWVVRMAEGSPLPAPPSAHVFYPLASLSRRANQPVIGAGDIADLRQTGVNLAALEAELTDARGTKASLDNRLDESLTEGGELRHNVVGDNQIKDNNVVATKLADFAVTTPKIANGAVNNNKIEDNSLSYSKLRNAQTIDYEIVVPGNDSQSSSLGAPDAFRLVSVDVKDEGVARDVGWSFRSLAWLSGSPPAMFRSTYVVLKNNSGQAVTVRVRAYVLANPA